MLNALSAITLSAGRHTLSGFSVAGLATYLQVADLDVCFDMGECPLTAVPLNHVLLTHAHGDHARCLLRHHALRGMLGITRRATYYMPEAIVPAFRDVIDAEARFEEEAAPTGDAAPHVVGLRGDRQLTPLSHRRDLFISAFEVTHRVSSLGYTLVERRRKLLPELAELDGPAIAERKRRGEPVTHELDAPLITFIGDCIGDSLLAEAHIWRSPVVVIETTFIGDGEAARARDTGHTHLDDFLHVLACLGDTIETQHIVLKHFSMKHSREEILEVMGRKVPPEWRSRVALLI